MASFFAFFCAVSLVVFPHSGGVARAYCPLPIVNQIAETADFSVQNQTTVNVGWCNIHLSDDSHSYINVTGEGTFSTSICATAYECTIHGQTFGPNTPTWIIIDAHTSVKVTWTDNVIVVDEMQTY